MLPKEVVIPVPPRRNVEVTLHLVHLQTPIHPTRVLLHAPAQPGSARKLFRPRLRAAAAPHLFDDMSRPRVLPLFLLPRPSLLLIPLVVHLHLPRVHPHGPARGVAREYVGSQDAVARRVLHVDVQVGARHCNDSVEVDLHLVPDAPLHGELLRRVASVPGEDLGEGEEERDGDEEDGGVAAVGAAAGVGRFDFRCSRRCELAVDAVERKWMCVNGRRYVRKASKPRSPPTPLLSFSEKAASSRPCCAKPFMGGRQREMAGRQNESTRLPAHRCWQDESQLAKYHDSRERGRQCRPKMTGCDATMMRRQILSPVPCTRLHSGIPLKHMLQTKEAN